MSPLIVAGAVALLAVALFARSTVYSPSPVKRAKWRIKFLMHPGPGWASCGELATRWSRLAALHHGRRARPSLKLRHRLVLPATAFAVRLGRGQWGRRLYSRNEDERLIVAAKRTGKALALDTPVPTPDGWATMGVLQEGDLVFGADGQPCRVTRAWPVRYGRPCYEVTFSDGSIVTADADHLWLVRTFASRRSESRQKLYRHDTPYRNQQYKRKLPQVLGTADMASSVRIPYGYTNYSVRPAASLALPDADLLVPPYTLGAWLGDGTAKTSDITSVDLEIIKEIEGEGETCIQSQAPYAERYPIYRVAGLRPRLRAIGVLQNKHIPPTYLRASETQRRALLAGLLDTDGSCDKSNNVEFYATNERLARDVRHLFATLGYKSRLRAKPAKFNGKDCGTCWIVTASPADPVFRLPRKLERHTPGKNTRKDLYITDIRPVESVPVRCVTVDRPDGLYLVGDTCIPTHNSGIVADRIITHRGPVLSSTSRTDIYDMTSGLRSRLGPVYRFNPMGVGNVPNDVRWDIMGACNDVLRARQVASWLKVPDIAGNDLAWFQHKGDVYLGAMLYAAAISGHTILDVYRWNELQGHGECLKILGGDPRTVELTAICRRAFADNRTSGSVRDTVQLSLSWCVLPGLAEIVTPPRGQGFSVADFTGRRPGTLYLIATGEDDSPVTPLFRALTMWIAMESGLAGSRSPYSRLEPPLLMSMDEIAVTNPIDLVSLLSDSSGKGVLIEPVCHSLAQLKRRYGEHQADDIWGLCGTKVLLGAISDDVTLDRASKLCGKVPGGEKDRLVLPPELLRQIPSWRAVIIRMDLAPAAVKIRPAWHRLMFRIGRHPLPPPNLGRPAPEVLLRVPAPALEPGPVGVPTAANGHGGPPGPLVKAGLS